MSAILLLLATACCFSGCIIPKPQYKQSEADAVAKIGSDMIKVWLSENMCDAELLECSAHIEMPAYDGYEYLTDYVSGTVLVNGEKKSFALNTVTGAVYFSISDSSREKLYRIAEEYFCEALGIVSENLEEPNNFGVEIMAPVTDGDSQRTVPELSHIDFGLPATVDDLEDFVRSPLLRPRL